ncbi:Phosphate-binding protein PstS 1 precursor [compost metagenome]
MYPSGEYKVYDSIVMSNNTVHAYESLIKGEADIIFAAQPSAEQRNEAKAAGLELKLTPIGREAFVFFVHKDNPVKGVTVSNIQDIYSGQVTNWKELGGKDSGIRAFQRPDNSGSQTMLMKLMEGRTLMTPPKKDVAAGMGGIIEQTADYRNYPNAIGYSFLYFATEMINNGEIRLLEVNKVKPERDTIASGEYPLTAEFYAVTAGSSNPNVEPFLQWMTSEQGQLIVERTGYTPLSSGK